MAETPVVENYVYRCHDPPLPADKVVHLTVPNESPQTKEILDINHIPPNDAAALQRDVFICMSESIERKYPNVMYALHMNGFHVFRRPSFLCNADFGSMTSLTEFGQSCNNDSLSPKFSSPTLLSPKIPAHFDPQDENLGPFIAVSTREEHCQPKRDYHHLPHHRYRFTKPHHHPRLHQQCCSSDDEQMFLFYEALAKRHQKHIEALSVQNPPQPSTPRPFLILVLEHRGIGCKAAAASGMCVVGLNESMIDREMLLNHGAAVAVASIDEFFERFAVKSYYQMQYLPLCIHLLTKAETKMGYPVSLLDMIHGKYTDLGVLTIPTPKTTGLQLAPNGRVVVEVSTRLVHREVLGIVPGSLADEYINNIGWTYDTITGWGMNSRDLEKDIIVMLGRLFGLGRKEARGFVTSGGTEGDRR